MKNKDDGEEKSILPPPSGLRDARDRDRDYDSRDKDRDNRDRDRDRDRGSDRRDRDRDYDRDRRDSGAYSRPMHTSEHSSFAGRPPRQRMVDHWEPERRNGDVSGAI